VAHVAGQRGDQRAGRARLTITRRAPTIDAMHWTRPLVWMFLAAAVHAAGCNCGSNGGEGATGSAVAEADQAPLVEEREDGKAEWMVQPDGRVRVRVVGKDGKAVRDASGTVTVNAKAVPLVVAGDALVASVPPLEGALTEIAYALQVGGSKWTGSLHVPAGGTQELLQPPTVSVPEGTRGPNGGIVDVVGDQRVEILVDKESGEVRVFLLDEKLQAVPVTADTEITIAFTEGSR
jgi:hypothetical protein